MAVDKEVLSAVKSALGALKEAHGARTQTKVISALAPLAGSGVQLDIDVAASDHIGAPLVVVSQPPAPDLSALTPRQREVTRLLATGCTNQQIADALHISLLTVKDHVHAILDRLDLPSRKALIARYHGADIG